MTLDDLKRVMTDRGIVLFIEKGSLRYRAPLGALTDELKQHIATHREAILRSMNRQNGGQKCRSCDSDNWVDEAPLHGRIRTHCGSCGGFIGYRPQDLAVGRDRTLVPQPPI